MGADPQLAKVVDYLVATEKKVADGTFGKARRPWLDFEDVEKAGKFDLEKQHKIFDRDASNTAYVKAHTEPDARLKEARTAKLSIDLLAGMDRDHKMRIRSRVRMMVHGGVRAKSLGDDKGPIRRNMIDWQTRILSEQKGT